MNIVEDIRAQAHGDRVAILDGDLAISFDSLLQAVEVLKSRLQIQSPFLDHALPRIGVRFPNGLGYIVLALAVIESGACFVPIPDELTEEERQTLIEKTALHAVISPTTENDREVRALKLPFDLGSANIQPCDHFSCLFPVDAFEALDPAFIRFSSGTTATSKGVVLSHRSLLERITAANQGLQITPGDRVLWTLPMAHHFAVSIVLYLYFGATTILEATHQPDEIFKAAQQSRAHYLYGSPFHFAQLAQCITAAPLPDLKLAITTAASLSEDVAKAFYHRFTTPLTQALGIIEVGLPILNRAQASGHPTALGQVLDAYDWKISAQNNDRIGELMLRGPGMFDAYLIPWQTRKDVTEDGWFATGDLVELLDGSDHTLVMRGRCKSVINVGGMKVFPEEIEAVLNEHPQIDRCRIISTHHPTLGSYPRCEYLPATMPEATNTTPEETHAQPLTLRDLRIFCKNRLASYKIPLTLKPVSQLPLTASGKIKRY